MIMLGKMSALGFDRLGLEVAHKIFHVFSHAVINLEVSSR